MARRDPHSYADDTQAQTASFALTARHRLRDARRCTRRSRSRSQSPGGGRLDLDTRDLAIEIVARCHRPRRCAFTRAPAEPYPRPAARDRARPTATPRDRDPLPDVAGRFGAAVARARADPRRRQPYLFSQCQAIHARSVIPLQDTPRLRVRYTAELTIPRTLRAVMAAADRGRTEHGERRGATRFEMPQPIPPYLFAFAVGDLASRDLSPRCRVWAEPAVVDAAAYEFAEVEAMIGAAEALFGPYDWERFDILTMPPSFPYGGMENPRLTFLTPTVIAGDRSLVSRRRARARALVDRQPRDQRQRRALLAQRGLHDLRRAPDRRGARGRRRWRRCTPRSAGASSTSRSNAFARPAGDDAGCARTSPASTPTRRTRSIPYEKGYLFLCAIEAAVGRPAFAALAARRTSRRSGSARSRPTTSRRTSRRRCPARSRKVDARALDRWRGRAGDTRSPRRARSGSTRSRRSRGALPPPRAATRWSATEWELYLEPVPRPATAAHVPRARRAVHAHASTNHDVLVPWLTLALAVGLPRGPAARRRGARRGRAA